MDEFINWNYFKTKYNQREQWAFENMAYFLFCSENDCPLGIFAYKNQPGIETEPIEKDGEFIGFQAKYYDSISNNKKDIKDSIDKAKEYYPSISHLLFYINSKFSKDTRAKSTPKYKTEIEEYAQSKNIIIKWRVPSHIEYQLLQPKNKWIKDIFFGRDGLDPVFFSEQIDKSIDNLGPRYHAKLNFELPIAKLFDTIEHNDVFYKRLVSITNNFICEKSYCKFAKNEQYYNIEEDVETLKNDLKTWITSFDYSVENSIEIKYVLDKIDILNKKINEARRDLYENKSSNQIDKELYRFREIENSNYDFLNKIKDLNINLSNNPTLIINGETGCGKSHLLGDIATRRKDLSSPIILLLGTNFKDDTIEKNILALLGLSCPFSDFINNLNEIGLKMKSRVLIMIDAINEGPGHNLWRNQIAGFVDEIKKYPAVGLVLSIRNTYFKEIIPSNFQSNPDITIIEHEGFKGNEYEALRMFCNNYGLKMPSFPILNPEYSNPLFLHLICETVKDSEEKTFPLGFYGIREIFKKYLDCKDEDFGIKRHEYKYRKIVSGAVDLMSKAIFDSEYGLLKIEEAYPLFDKHFPSFKDLLTDLIEDGIFIKQYYGFKGNGSDCVNFSFQRIGEFCIVEDLLKSYSTYEDLLNGFENDFNLNKIKANVSQYRGLLEAMSILIPEKYNHELFELLEYFIDKSMTNQYEINWHIEYFTQLSIDSLKWRTIKSIDSNKITTWIESHNCIDQNTWLNTLAELSIISNHPFNSDYLHHLLSNISMPIRDGFWQKYLLFYRNNDDDNIAYPFKRLIDWAWSSDISRKTDAETARLVAQTLAWGLASTNNTLRDQITKSMVNLLEQQPESLICILETFEKVDDPYILERLFAIAYGCTLRTETDKSITLIAEYVYETIFKNGYPPAHILLRDYARNIIEYALYRNLIKNIDEKMIRPPYHSSFPIFPQNNEVQCYKLDYNDSNFKLSYGQENNAIYESLLGCIADFGHYIVDNSFSNFSTKLIQNSPKGKFVRLDSYGARNWIIKRVFELGYDREIHGEYDSIVGRYAYYKGIYERIGKKYQWIAYYELMACISDNYWMVDRWQHDKYISYNGPWQLSMRNIDPIYIKQNNEQEGIDIIKTKNEWWEDVCCSKWDAPDEEWVNDMDNLPSPPNIIQKQDNKGIEWLRLGHFVSWEEPQQIDDNTYNRKQISFSINAYIVKKSDKQGLVTYLSKQNFWDRFLPGNNEYTSLFNREKYWSPAYKDEKDENTWQVLEDTNYSVLIADEYAKGTIDNDKSGSNQNYSIPCRFIFEGLNLKYAPTDGDLKNADGETIVINKDGSGCLIRKKELLEFLRKKDLDIIWTVLGDKYSFYDNSAIKSYFKVPCGVYYIDGEELKGTLKNYDRISRPRISQNKLDELKAIYGLDIENK